MIPDIKKHLASAMKWGEEDNHEKHQQEIFLTFPNFIFYQDKEKKEKSVNHIQLMFLSSILVNYFLIQYISFVKYLLYKVVYYYCIKRLIGR